MKYLGCLLLSCLLSGKAIADKIPIEALAKLPNIYLPILSPLGDKIAATMAVNGEQALVIMDYDAKSNKFSNFTPLYTKDSEVEHYFWGNNDRLVVYIKSIVKRNRRFYDRTQLGSFDQKSKKLTYFKRSKSDHGALLYDPTVVSRLKNDSEHVLAVVDHGKEVHKVNINTGSKKHIQSNNISASYWVADDEGNIRIAVKYQKIGRSYKAKTLYRKTVKDKWETLQKTSWSDNDRLIPLYFKEDDPNILIFSSQNLDDEQNEAVLNDDEKIHSFAYDLTERKIIGPYVNSDIRALRELIKKAVPDYQVRVLSRTKDKSRYTLKLYSDIQPTLYAYFDRSAKKFSIIGEQYKNLKDYKFAPMERVSYSARDGLKIPAFLTMPKKITPEKPPLVVLVHGGPHLRDLWGFDPTVQLLSDRGYAVLQPQFRGSTGQGIDFLEAGYGQWGKLMQDDLADGAQWLIDEGKVDPKKVCIVGGSYGGFAASLGLAKTPKLFKCAVSLNGLHDLADTKANGRFWHNKLLYDSKNKPQEDYRSVSSYHMAEKIEGALLLVHGTKDQIVPVSQSERMYKRLKKLKKQVDYIPIKGADHSLKNEEQIFKYMDELEKFLAKQIGS